MHKKRGKLTNIKNKNKKSAMPLFKNHLRYPSNQSLRYYGTRIALPTKPKLLQL